MSILKKRQACLPADREASLFKLANFTTNYGLHEPFYVYP